jgi:hypothetical protein
VPPGYDVRVKDLLSADLIHNSDRVKSPRFQEGKIPIFRIGALLILINKDGVLSCTANFAVIEFRPVLVGASRVK